MKFNYLDLNDWRIQELEYRGLTFEIIGNMLDIVIPDSFDPQIEILEPGLSGFIVLRLIYSEHSSENQIVLKIINFIDGSMVDEVIKNEKNATNSFLKKGIETNIFIPCAESYIFNKTWLILTFYFANGMSTFKRFFSDYIKLDSFKLEKGSDIIRKTLEYYNRKNWALKPVNTYPWNTNTTSEITPLSQKNYYAQYLRSIHRITSLHTELIKGIDLNKKQIDDLLLFIKSDTYNNLSIDPNPVHFPISEVHGDLNSGNILVNYNDTNDEFKAVFIDFSQMSKEPDHHILFDIGKLSIDFERFIIPNYLFDDNRLLILQNWLDIHNEWINNKSIERYNNSKYSLFYRIYSLLNVFKEHSIKLLTNNGDNQEALRHFYFVRLHHILRIINHAEIDDIRKIFAIKAAIDLLDYFNGTPRSTNICKNLYSGVYFDCTSKDFVEHLTNAQRVCIIGITNENLSKHINEAFNKRVENQLGEWEEIKVIFPSQKLLQSLKDINDVQDVENDIDSRWNQGLTQVRETLLNAQKKVAKFVDIRHSDKFLSFIGQCFDEKYIRVAFILPNIDLRNSCYANFSLQNSPCRDLQIVCNTNGNKDEKRQCKKNKLDYNCEDCDWKENSSCKGIKKGLNQIINDSTPLFSANVCGKIEQKEKFTFEYIIPQFKWREFSIIGNEKPTHLFVFILLKYNNNLLLQLRTADNTSGVPEHKYGVIPGKVNDEDFFFDNKPSQKYRERVALVQQIQYKENYDRIVYLNGLSTLSKMFADECKLTIDKPIPEDVIEKATRKAAVRTILEKLGIDVKESSFDPQEKYIVDKGKGKYNLFIMLYTLDINNLEYGIINEKRPYSGLESIDKKRFAKLKNENKLTQFLRDNFGEINNFF